MKPGVLACALFGTLIAVPAFAETPTVFNEYYFDGTELRCAVDPSVMEGKTQDQLHEAVMRLCLNMGALHVRMARSDAEALLPPVKGEPAMFKGVPHYTYVYVIDRQPAGYYVIGYHNDKIVSLQATGREVIPPALFSTIGLGSSSEEVRQQFGPPDQVRPVADLGGEEWVYGLFSVIVIEPLGVYSIRVEAPEMVQ